MLLLTRRVGEAVVIGEGIEVRVMQVQGGQVRLGISAPKSVAILRTELLERSKDGAERKHEGAA